MMNKLKLIFIFLLVISSNLFAQNDKKIDEVITLFSEKDYTKTISKGVKLTEDNEYGKHPLAYLYTSMAYYQIAQNPSKYDAGTRDSDYPNPLKDAQKYLEKFLKAETKTEKYFPDYETNVDQVKEFSENIARATNIEAQSYFIADKASKAVSVYKYGLKAIPNEPVLLLWQGVSEVAMKNTIEGEKNIMMALDTIDENFTPSNATKGVLYKGLLLAEEYLSSKGMTKEANKAKSLAEIFKKDDGYNQIVTAIENPEIPENLPADKKIDDLVFLYVDGKYEDAVFKGMNLMENDDYSKHPAPYFYTAMAYYEMSKRPGTYDVGEKDSKYPNPLKDAQKYLAKFNKAQLKSSKYFPYYRQDDDEVNDFYYAIADTTNQIGQLFFLNEDYRKAAGFYKYGVNAVPNDPILLLWKGICEIESKNTSEGDKTLNEAMESFDENFIPSKATSSVLAYGMLLAEEYFRTKGNYVNADKAKKLIDVFKKYDPDELDKKKMEERKAKAKKDNQIMRKFFSDEDDEDNKQKGKIIIEKGEGSNENSTKSANDKLDELEKEATDGGK